MHLLALVTHPLHVWRCPCCPSISRFIGSLARICSLVSPPLLRARLFMRIGIVLSRWPILLGREHLLFAHMHAPSLEKTKSSTSFGLACRTQSVDAQRRWQDPFHVPS